MIVEIKAEKSLTNIDEAQLINSLIISRHNVGLLLNFGEGSLRYKKICELDFKTDFSDFYLSVQSEESVVSIFQFNILPHSSMFTNKKRSFLL